MAFAVGFALLEVAARSALGDRHRRRSSAIALGVKHNAWLMPVLSRRALPVDAARAICAARRLTPHPAGVRLDGGAGAADLLRALALALAGAGRAHARLRAAPPRARALQLRVPRPQLEPAADHHGDEAAARHRAVRRDRLHRAGDHAGARRLGAGVLAAPPPRRARRSRERRARGAGRPSARAGCARAPTSTARRGRSSLVQMLGPLAVAGRPVDADLRRREALPARDAVPGRAGGDRPRGARARAARRRCPSARARWRRAAPRRAGGARLPPGARRDAPLAPRRARPLQPAGGRLRRRRVAGHEPAVLGLLGAADAAPTSTAASPRTAGSTGTTSSPTRSRCTNGRVGSRWRSATPASARRASSARRWAFSSTKNIGPSTRPGSGSTTGRPARSPCASAKASRW